MGRDKLGFVHVYTGYGKGKTSSAVGVAVRAVGQGMKVIFIQFMKGGAYTGELIAAKNFLPNIEFHQFGRNCIKEVRQMKLLGFEKGYEFYDKVRDDIDCGPCRWCFVNDRRQWEYCRYALEKAKQVTRSGAYDLVVLDELNVAIAYNFVTVKEALDLIRSKFKNTELIITGRNAPQEITKIADYVTVFADVKHPFRDKKVLARRGIEY